MKPMILLCGDQIALNEKLLDSLGKIASVITVKERAHIREVLANQAVDVFLFEPSEKWELELALLKALRATYPGMIMIVVNGGQSSEGVIRAFRMGVNDYFRKPLDADLLAERIEALLRARSQ